MKHSVNRRAAGRRLGLERCEPRRMLSVTATSVEQIDDVSRLPTLREIASYVNRTTVVSEGADRPAIVSTGFLPPPVGSGSVPIDLDSDLVSLDSVAPRSFGVSDSLHFGASEGLGQGLFTQGSLFATSTFNSVIGSPRGFVDSLDGQRESFVIDVSASDFGGLAIPAITAVEIKIEEFFPVQEPSPEVVDAPVGQEEPTPIAPTSGVFPTTNDQPSDQALASVLAPSPSRPVSPGGFLSGPVLGPLSLTDPSPSPRATNFSLGDGSDVDWIDVQGNGRVDRDQNDRPAAGFENTEFPPVAGTGSEADPAPEIEEGDKEPLVAESPSEPTATLPAAGGSEVVGRLAFYALPPRSDEVGAGAIDLTDLLFAEELAAHKQAVRAVAHDRAVETDEDLARDAALAVESWVRAIPSPASPRPDGGVIRAGSEPAAAVISSIIPSDRSTGSVRVSIGGDRLSAAETPLEGRVSSDPSEPDAGDRAAIRLERPSVYRYALSAISVLLGGAVFSVARGRGSDAGPGRKPSLVGRSHPGEAGREIRQSCE